ncbi:MAG: hypothetical protein K0U38_00715, partial [Epsilonproteobacteria bacterium]|nr:hypothetical protein [Campylobacterota bacterium]
LTLLSNQDKRCKRVKADKVVLFNSKFRSVIKKEVVAETVPHYNEMALGDFTIESEDSDLVDAFNKIKNSIEQQCQKL